MRAFRVVGVIALIITSIAAVPPIRAPTANEPVPPISPSGTQSSPPSGSPGEIKRPIDNATSYLAINESWINTTTIETVTLDAGGVIMSSTRKIERTVNIEQFTAAIRNASNKQAVIDAALDRAANRSDELRARQITAIQAYNNGKLSTQALLRELAIIGEKANQLRIYIENIRSVRVDLNRSVGNRITYLKRELNTLTGPVRREIQSMLRGDLSASQRYFVRTSTKGIVIATIDDDRYMREVYLAEARTVTNTSAVTTPTQAGNFSTDSYPVAKNWHGADSYTFKKHGLYWFKFYRGSTEKISIYVNKSSGEVFYEERILHIFEDNTVPAKNNTSEHYALTTRRTHPGGYMRIRLTNRSNGEGRNGTISINNETIGVTERDGTLYILQPGKLTTINATINGETLSVTVGQPSQTPPPHPIPAPDSSSGFGLLSEHTLRAKEKDIRD